MANCPTCKESILNQTESLIGQTQCNQPCPQDITCEDIVASDCVFYSGVNLQCSGIVYSDTLTNALQKIEQKLCNISEKCFTWDNVTYNDNLMDLVWRDSYSVTFPNTELKYSTNTVSCRAGFKGACVTTIPASGTVVYSRLFTIPVLPNSILPTEDRSLSVNAIITNSDESKTLIVPAVIRIVSSTGDVIVFFTNYNPLVPTLSGDDYYFEDAINLGVLLSLDNLYYEINT